MKMDVLAVRNAGDIRRLLTAYANQPNGGLVVLPDTVLVTNGSVVINEAARHRLPAMYPFQSLASDGGLVSYGSDQSDLYRRAASYVDRILRGAKPTDLPVQSPTKYE